jgi:Tol biopolymer transport system component
VALLPVHGDPVPWATLPEPSARTEIDSAVRFSPDGRWIAYQGRESGRWEIYLAEFPSGRSKRQVSTAGGVEPVWRPDGRELFYLAPDGSLMAIRFGDETTRHASPPERLCASPVTGERGPGAGSGTYDVSADGQRFVFASASNSRAASGPITILANWPAKLGHMAH